MISGDKMKNLIAYCHAPVSLNIHGVHMMFFDVLDVLAKKFNIYVLSRSKDTYDYYKNELAKRCKNKITLIRAAENSVGENYQFGLIKDEIDKSIDGKIDSAFWFSSGLINVTPEDVIKDVYDRLSNGEIRHGMTKAYRRGLHPVVQEAEMLYEVLKHKPKFNYRVVDYTEPHIEKITGYPMKLLCFYDDKSRGHHKIHDGEHMHFCSNKIKHAEKIYDFVFGYTVEIPERAYLSDFCMTKVVQNDKFKLFVKDKYYSKYSPIDTQLPSEEYFDKLRYAKFSLIAPSTDPNEVSLYRIYEDISRRCIPIFMKTVKYWKVFDYELCAFIRDNLVFDEHKYKTINDFIGTLDYDKLIDELMNCKMIKSFYDKDLIEQKLLDEVE